MNQEWDIKPRGQACAGCQQAFRDEQFYCTRLFFGPQGYERSDFCEPCWESAAKNQPRYSVWKGVYHVPPPEPERTVKKETAELLLRRLLADQDESKKNVIYILAVMLERQRLLVEREIRKADNGAKLVVYEHRKTGESFVLEDPQLRLTEIEQVQKDVMALLSDADATAAPPPA